MLFREYNLLGKLSTRSIEAQILNNEMLCRTAESKNDRARIVHYHIMTEALRNELQKRTK